MGKFELHRVSFLSDKNDDPEKELYLKELGDSVYHYIKTGVKNKQLDSLIKLEEEFQSRFQECFNVGRITDFIYEIEKIIISEVAKNLVLEKWDIDNKNSQDDICQILLEKTSSQVKEIANEKAGLKLSEMMKDTAYLSHVNMLYELYEKEEKLRREEKEFTRISEKYQKMAEISNCLIGQRRMTIEELEEQVDISDKDLQSVLYGCEKYFNIRSGKGTIQVSLSPIGRRFHEYLLSNNVKYSYDRFHQLLYKNYDNLLESLENSLEKKLHYEVRFEEVAPDIERALTSKYYRIVDKLISENEESYIIVGRKRGSVIKNNERNSIQGREEWDDEEYRLVPYYPRRE